MANLRALGDIQDSIDELRYYREAVFVPAPGPDSATAQRIARKVMGVAEDPAPAEAASGTPAP